MFRKAFCATTLALSVGVVASTGGAFASDQATYVLSSWGPGSVGNCLVDEKHTTTDCEAATGLNGSRLSAQFVETYLNNKVLPDVPVGKRLWVMIKLREPVRGLPPDTAQPAVTALHLQDLQRQYYPRAALSAKLEGRASADCDVLENGQLDNCWVTDEMPAASGFGEATLKLINLMKLTSPLPVDRKQHFDLTWQLPGPADQVFVDCLITSDLMTSDCTTDPDPDFPGAAQAVLNSLASQPLHLLGAPAGQRLEIALLRSELGKAQSTGHGSATTPYRPVHLTALNANDVLYYYPPISVRLAEMGHTVVRCKVTDDGRLNECWIAGGSFARLGLAHLRLTEIVRMQPPDASAPAYDQRLYAFQVTWTLNQ